MKGSVYLGIDPTTGKPLKKYVRAKTERELKKKKDAIKFAYGRGDIAAKDIRFADWARTWLNATHPKDKTSANTYRMYGGAVDRLIAHFGANKLSRIRQITLEEYLAARPPQAARIELIILKSMFRKARKNKYVADDPAEEIKLAVTKAAPKRDLETFERGAIKTAVLSPRERAFVCLAFKCGLRRGEIYGLTPEAINDRVRVRQVAVIGLDDMALKQLPKTERSYRSVPIPDDALATIKDYAATIEPGQLLFGQTNRTKHWRLWRHITSRINDAAGGKSHYDAKRHYRIIDDRKLLKPFTTHLLRHAYCCDLYRAGYRPGEVMRLMGHSSIRLSIEVYEHIAGEKITASKLNKKGAVLRVLPVRAGPMGGIRVAFIKDDVS